MLRASRFVQLSVISRRAAEASTIFWLMFPRNEGFLKLKELCNLFT